MIPQDTIIRASDDLVFRDLDDKSVILSLRTGTYYSLDAVGCRIWTLVQLSRSVAEIRDVLLSEYEVEAAVCEDDLSEFIEDLASEGLVIINDEMAH